jgi:CPA1 family monovalent cation:H+ antiporter
LLGALLSITDTVSVLLAFRSVRVPHRLASIMEGESLFNDGTALVLVSLAAAVLLRGHADPLQTTRALLLAIVGGVVLGALFGLLGGVVLRRTPDHLTAILASLVLVFSTSLVAERFHASPVIAVVVTGLMVGHAARTALEPSRVLALQGFWETAGFVLNVWIFLLVGMQLRADLLIDEAGPIALALLALHAGRAVAVYGTFAVLRGPDIPMRWQHVMVFGNIKGALSMAAVLALPANLPHRDRLVAIVFGVTFVTLVTQALPFRKILVWLGVVSAGAERQIDAAKATLIGARRAQKELEELIEAGLISRKDHAERFAGYQRQVIEAERQLRGPKGEIARDHLADLALLTAQKSAVLDAARRGLISLEVAEAQVSEFDRALLDSTRHDEGKDD